MQYANYQYLLTRMIKISRKISKMCPKTTIDSPLHGILRGVYMKVNKESAVFAEDFSERIMQILAPNCKETLYFPTVPDLRLEKFLDLVSYAKKRIRTAPISARQQYLIEVHICHHIINVVEQILIGQGHPFRHYRNEDVMLLEEDMGTLEDFVKTWPIHMHFKEGNKNRNFRLVANHEDAILRVVKLREILANYFQMDIKSLKELMDNDHEESGIIEGVIFHRFAKNK
eukprot:NODE_396_length_9428_cov_0.525137.p5 type:complete len:229 gc:universal NODE_396_length_9428_cov_0.525137:4093-3407(-)